MAQPSYINKQGLISFTQDNWKKVKGNGTKENPYIFNGKPLSGNIDVEGKRKNLVNGVIVKANPMEFTNPSEDMGTADIAAGPTTDPASTTEPASTTDIRKNLGIGVALLGPDSIYKDELQIVFNLWKEKKYTEAQDIFYTTKFSKLSTDARSRYLLKLENTDLYKQSLKSFAVSMKQALTLNGLSLTDKEIEDYYIKGTPENLILDDALTAFSSKPGANPKGQIGENLATLKQVAAANGLDINSNFGSSIDEWLRSIANGESIETYKQVIRDTAKRGLPDKVAALLDKGVDLEAIYSPYKNAMASLLEVNPQTITLDDPTLRMAIGPDKEMSLYDFQRTLRKDSRWQYTNKAREEVSSITQNVLRDFGFQG